MKNGRFSALLLTLMLGLLAQAEIPKGYYDKCENKPGGKTLLQALHEVVGPHKTVSYDNLYEVYVTSDTDDDGMIWDMYSTKRWPTGSQHCGSYKKVGDCYNREHSMPKSWFNEGSPMKSDAFHVVPTDGYVNNQRSNYPYGECANGVQVAASGNVKPLGRLGNSTFPGYSGKVFEPDDEFKGDFARAYFYMAACYMDKIKGWNSDMLAKNDYPCYTSWAVDLLLKWHRQDPVSEKELKRNDAIYAWQNNRNPFIDYPELAEYVWGKHTADRWTSSGAIVDPTPDPDPQPEPDPNPTPDPDPIETGLGSADEPYNCAQVMALQSPGSVAWVAGYIVGSINGTAIEYYTNVTTNMAIADTQGEATATNTLGVQLPNGSDLQSALNLKEHRDYAGRKIALQGRLTDYFGRPGIKDVVDYKFIDTPAEGGILATSAAVSVTACKGGVKVSCGAEWTDVTISGLDGILWFNGQVSETETFSLPKGIYLVRAAGNIYRILVK